MSHSSLGAEATRARGVRSRGVKGGEGSCRWLWLGQASDASALVTTVCTGSALLARTGRLDGIAATSNKAAFKWVMAQGPKVDWKAEARWVEDGKFMTSSGVSAGMDMALAAVQRLYGEAEAERVATRTEYDWKRDASWDPFAKIHGLV